MEALMEKDSRVRGGQVIWTDTEEMRGMEEDGARFLKRLKGCTACVCYNDETAYKLVRICQTAGKCVPDDLSIVGIDNSALAQFCSVPLTSFENPAEELGKTAAEMMTGRILRNEKMESREFEPQLVMRSSVRVVHEI